MVGVSSVTYDVTGVVGAAVSIVVLGLLAQCALFCNHKVRQQPSQKDGSDGGKLLDLNCCDWYALGNRKDPGGLMKESALLSYRLSN